MDRTAAREDRHIRELDDEQSWALFDEAAMHYLGINGEQFLVRWEDGEFENPDEPEVMSVLMLLPFTYRSDTSS